MIAKSRTGEHPGDMESGIVPEQTNCDCVELALECASDEMASLTRELVDRLGVSRRGGLIEAAWDWDTLMLPRGVVMRRVFVGFFGSPIAEIEVRRSEEPDLYYIIEAATLSGVRI